MSFAVQRSRHRTILKAVSYIGRQRSFSVIDHSVKPQPELEDHDTWTVDRPVFYDQSPQNYSGKENNSMTIHETRSRQIVATIAGIKAILAGSTDIEYLNKAKALLMDLSDRCDLFLHADFPIPDAGHGYRVFRLYQEDGGEFALYLVTVAKGATDAPHDHGTSWAIVSAIDGQEQHHLYKRIDDGKTPGTSQLEYAGELMVERGSALSMQVSDIHSIKGVGAAPCRHLHLYGYGFEHQKDRKEFDLKQGTYIHSHDDVGFIEDFPLHPGMQ